MKVYRRLLLVALMAFIAIACSRQAPSSTAPTSPESTPVAAGGGRCGADAVNALDATRLEGSIGTVEGDVVLTHYASTSRGEPTFLNFHNPYPGYFTVVIFGSDRANFSGAPETMYYGHHVCVHGPVQDYRGAPELIVKTPDQITISDGP